MDQTQLHRGNEIREQLNQLAQQKRGLELDNQAADRRINLIIEGKQSENDSWRSVSKEAIVKIIGKDAYESAVNVSRILILEAVSKKIAELQKEFEEL